jgi:LruC domain-containing protein
VRSPVQRSAVIGAVVGLAPLLGAPAPAAAESLACDPAATSIAYAPARDTFGMLLFEDMWPENGDLDFNDQSVAYNFVLVQNAEGKTLALQASLSMLSAGGVLRNGLHLHLPVPASAAQTILLTRNGQQAAVTPRPGEDDLVITIAEGTRALFAGGEEGVVNVLAVQPAAPATPTSLLIRFAQPVDLDPSKAPFDLFIARTGKFGHQVHLPPYGGTAGMDRTLFGQGDDASLPTWHFINHNGLPFALHVPASVPWPREGVSLDRVYPDVGAFAASGGTQHTDWYLTNQDRSLAWTGGAGNTPPPVPSNLDPDFPAQQTSCTQACPTTSPTEVCRSVPTDGTTIDLGTLAHLIIPPAALLSPTEIQVSTIESDLFEASLAGAPSLEAFVPGVPRIRIKAARPFQLPVTLEVALPAEAASLRDAERLSFAMLIANSDVTELVNLGGYPCESSSLCIRLLPDWFSAISATDPDDPVIELVIATAAPVQPSTFSLWRFEDLAAAKNLVALPPHAALVVDPATDSLEVSGTLTLAKNFSVSSGTPLPYLSPSTLTSFMNAGFFYSDDSPHSGMDLRTNPAAMTMVPATFDACESNENVTDASGILVRPRTIGSILRALDVRLDVAPHDPIPWSSFTSDLARCDSNVHPPPASCASGSGGGNFVEIEHDPHCSGPTRCLRTAYRHLSSQKVHLGFVDAQIPLPWPPDAIACTGDTGTWNHPKFNPLAYAPHLHLGVEYMGKRVDVEPLLRGDMSLFVKKTAKGAGGAETYFKILRGNTPVGSLFGRHALTSAGPVRLESGSLPLAGLAPGDYKVVAYLDGARLGGRRALGSWTLNVACPAGTPTWNATVGKCVLDDQIAATGSLPVGGGVTLADDAEGNVAASYMPVGAQGIITRGVNFPFAGGPGAGMVEAGISTAPRCALRDRGVLLAYPVLDDTSPTRLVLKFDGEVQPGQSVNASLVDEALVQGDRATLIEPAGRAAVVYHALSTDPLGRFQMETRYARWNGSGWDRTTLAPGPLISHVSNIGGDSDPASGVAFATYVAWEASLAAMNFNLVKFGLGGSIATTTIGSGDPSGASITGYQSDVAADAQGRGHVAYINLDFETTLNYFGPAGASAIQVPGEVQAEQVAVDVDSSGRPYVAVAVRDPGSSDPSRVIVLTRRPGWVVIPALTQPRAREVFDLLISRDVIHLGWVNEGGGLAVRRLSVAAVP